ncbi:hypothetical protein BDZ45DRAFT_721492 [Acephala macrosclerotiorum]|nr:hypothetical protein BDZ45DRAFT_721492 [Acephala macrosclerotiorum]
MAAHNDTKAQTTANTNVQVNVQSTITNNITMTGELAKQAASIARQDELLSSIFSTAEDLETASLDSTKGMSNEELNKLTCSLGSITGELCSEVRHQRQELGKQDHELAEKHKQIAELKAIIAKHKKENSQKGRRDPTWKQKHAEVSRKLNKDHEATKKYQRENESLREQVEALKLSKQNDNNLYRMRKEDFQAKNKQLGEALEKTEARTCEVSNLLQTRVSCLQARLLKERAEHAEEKHECDKLRRDYNELDEQYDQLKEEKDSLEAQNEVLKEKVSALKMLHTQQELLVSLEAVWRERHEQESKQMAARIEELEAKFAASDSERHNLAQDIELEPETLVGSETREDLIEGQHAVIEIQKAEIEELREANSLISEKNEGLEFALAISEDRLYLLEKQMEKEITVQSDSRDALIDGQHR